MEKEERRYWGWRLIIFFIGHLILAVGITLSTMTGLGVSCVTAVAYSISRILAIRFSSAVFILYTIMVALQFLIRGKNRRWRDLLQVPFSLVLSGLLRLCEDLIQVQPEIFWEKLLVLSGSIVFMAIGMGMTLNMHLLAGPPDALADAIGQAMGKDMGTGKNLLDLLCVILACVIDLLWGDGLRSLGLATVLSMIFVGRTLALFNHLFQDKILSLAGLRRESLCKMENIEV